MLYSTNLYSTIVVGYSSQFTIMSNVKCLFTSFLRKYKSVLCNKSK
jgi:hypothetical protein